MKKPYMIRIKEVGKISGCPCVSINFHNSGTNQRIRNTYYKKVGDYYRKLYKDEIEKIN